MTDCEVMTALGNQFDSEQRPALSKTKRSFLQKLTERHDALMLHMRIKTSEELDQDDRPAPSRTSSSSSTQKDLFKISPVTWPSKSDRAKTDFAMRYDDCTIDTTLPSPIMMHSPLDLDSSQLDQWSIAQADRHLFTSSPPRLHSSHSTISMASSCASPRTPTVLSPIRTRSIPCEMSDAQIDAWLDAPEDADAHRKRKSLSTHSPVLSERSARRRKDVARAMVNSQNSQNSTASKVFSDPFARSRRREASVIAEVSRGVTMAGIPDEVLRGIAGFLGEAETRAVRGTCRRLYVAVPEPERVKKA